LLVPVEPRMPKVLGGEHAVQVEPSLERFRCVGNC